jgi:hypothetical protein
MGFFDDIGEFFTGAKGKKAAADQAAAVQQAVNLGKEVMGAGQAAAAGGAETAKQGIAGMSEAQKQAAAQAARMQGGAAASMGENAAEYMQRANQAAEGQSAQAAQAGSTASARQALAAARSAGLNKGQASLRAAQGAGDTYTQQYQGGLESGRNQYQQGTQQFAQLGESAANRQGALAQGIGQLGASQQATGLQTQAQGAAAASGAGMSGANAQAQAAGQSGAAGGSALGGGLMALGTIFSDKNLKENVTESNTIDKLFQKVKQPTVNKDPLKELASKVKPVEFNYTPESGEDPGKRRTGVMAQDLEKTSMKDNVIDTPQGKMVDAGQQTMSNTNLIVQMAQKLFDMEAELKALKGGK